MGNERMALLCKLPSLQKQGGKKDKWGGGGLIKNSPINWSQRRRTTVEMEKHEGEEALSLGGKNRPLA